MHFTPRPRSLARGSDPKWAGWTTGGTAIVPERWPPLHAPKRRLPARAEPHRLRRHRRLPARHHPLRVVVRALPEDDQGLLPDGPVGALVGDLLHDRRHRDEHADLHRRAGAGLRRQHDVPAARARLHHRPPPRERALHPRLLPRRALHVLRAAAAALRRAGQDRGRGHLPGHPLARRRHPPVRDGARHRGRHAACR